MNRKLTPLLVCLSLALSSTVYAQADEADRVSDAAKVFEEIMNIPEKAIPAKILENAEAIAVFPGTLKGGFGIGVHRGKGILSARNRATGTWSAPGFLTLTGGSFGAQIGGQEIDLVLVVMNKGGLENLLRNEFKIGGEASVAAGPIGRGAEAATDIQMRAEILSYSRARGLFAGVSLSGSAIQEDEDAIRAFYGRPAPNAQIVDESPKPVGTAGRQPLPDAVKVWHDALAKHTK
jgi:lipid-binding SYLF domain-containing protein